MKIFALMYFCISFSLYNLGIQDVLYVWKFSKFEMCAGKTGVFLNNTWVQTNLSSVTNIPYAGIYNYWMRIERVLNLHMNGMLPLNCGNVTGDDKTDACIYVHSNVHVLSRYAITIDLNIKTGVCKSSVCRGILIEMGTPLCTLHIEYSHVFLSLSQNMSCALPCALLVDLTTCKICPVRIAAMPHWGFLDDEDHGESTCLHVEYYSHVSSLLPRNKPCALPRAFPVDLTTCNFCPVSIADILQWGFLDNNDHDENTCFYDRIGIITQANTRVWYQWPMVLKIFEHSIVAFQARNLSSFLNFYFYFLRKCHISDCKITRLLGESQTVKTCLAVDSLFYGIKASQMFYEIDLLMYSMTIHVENIISKKDRVDVVDLKMFGYDKMNNDVWILLCKCYCIHIVDNSINMSLMIICFMQSTNDQI